jgi:hypothetical protein
MEPTTTYSAERMKRDMNLVREMLFAVEKSDSGWAPDKYNIEGIWRSKLTIMHY